MENIVESLFGLSPWQVQQQQNAGMDAYASNQASKSLLQRSSENYGRAGGMFAQAGAEAMGMVNPQVEQAKQRQAMLGGLEPNAESIRQRALQISDPKLKFQLLAYANQLDEKEQAKKLAAAQLKNAIDPSAKPARKDFTAESWKVYERTGKQSDLVEAAVESKQTNDIQEYEYAKKNNGYKGTLEQWMQRKSQTSGSGGSESKQPLVYIDPVTGKAVWGNIGEAKGKPAAAYDPITKQLVSQGIELGKGRGDEIVNLPKMESALTSIKGAEGLLDKGIYTGFWGPAQKNVISATPGADKDKVSNTDQFVAYIGEVVVPRLKEFGGNDSNEELKYLQKISGGDISMQEPALRAILKNAEIKIQRGVDRVKKGMTPSGAPVANQGGIEKWERDASGKLVRVSR